MVSDRLRFGEVIEEEGKVLSGSLESWRGKVVKEAF